MDKSIGALVGTIFIALFGAVIAYFVPRLIAKEGPDHGAGDVPVGKWIRILGLVVMVIGVIQFVLILVL
jgi:hypothetical protein